MNYRVQTIKGSDIRECRAERAPDRFKCGHCGRGVILRFKDGQLQTRPCPVCKALVHAIQYEVPWAKRTRKESGRETR